MAGKVLADARTGNNGRHALVELLRQSVFGRLAGYEDVNDAERLRHDPAMRWIVGGKAASGAAASRITAGQLDVSCRCGATGRPDIESYWLSSRQLIHSRVSRGTKLLNLYVLNLITFRNVS